MSVTVTAIREAFRYNPATGEFTWKKHRCGNLIGKRAGYLSREDGYWLLSLRGEKIMGHIAAWMYVYGVRPDRPIDHRDVCKTNNRINNLRLSSKSDNGANRLAQKNNTSGFKGVFWHKKAGKWMVQIKVRGELIYGGLFNTKESAAVAYDDLAEKYFGDHARPNLGEAA